MSVLTNFLGSILKFIYESLQGLGNEPANISYYAIALILMALLQKLLTMPLTLKGTKNAQRGAELNPQVEAIRKKYANDPATANKKIMDLYKDNNYNPASGCLPMLIPLIIIFAMLNVIRNPGNYMFSDPEQIHRIATNFFWIPDLRNADKVIYGLPLIYAVSMVAYSSIMQQPATDEKMQSMNMMMKFMMPIMMFFFSRHWPAGLILYWATNNICEIVIRSLLKVFAKKKEETAS
ncbi:MAG: YidC/Oxa1 family membrane protein insertase [Tissierellia bacterium]|nr:YidC/Oxa1 family membrane protein insertase [Tissierellia bacterium]